MNEIKVKHFGYRVGLEILSAKFIQNMIVDCILIKCVASRLLYISQRICLHTHQYSVNPSVLTRQSQK